MKSKFSQESINKSMQLWGWYKAVEFALVFILPVQGVWNHFRQKTVVMGQCAVRCLHYVTCLHHALKACIQTHNFSCEPIRFCSIRSSIYAISVYNFFHSLSLLYGQNNTFCEESTHKTNHQIQYLQSLSLSRITALCRFTGCVPPPPLAQQETQAQQEQTCSLSHAGTLHHNAPGQTQGGSAARR